MSKANISAPLIANLVLIQEQPQLGLCWQAASFALGVVCKVVVARQNWPHLRHREGNWTEHRPDPVLPVGFLDPAPWHADDATTTTLEHEYLKLPIRHRPPLGSERRHIHRAGRRLVVPSEHVIADIMGQLVVEAFRVVVPESDGARTYHDGRGRWQGCMGPLRRKNVPGGLSEARRRTSARACSLEEHVQKSLKKIEPHLNILFANAANNLVCHD